MASVVQNSGSLYSAYLSTVDHLPCDVVRSLWVVQACNIAAENEKQKVHEALAKYDYREIENEANIADIYADFLELKRRIACWNSEAEAELVDLSQRLRDHEISLKNEVGLLAEALEPPLPKDRLEAQRTLEKQLSEHYQKHPLASQVEALQRRDLKGLGSILIKHVPGRSSGVKLILKLSKPKNDAARQKRIQIRKRGRPRKLEESSEKQPVRPLARAHARPSAKPEVKVDEPAVAEVSEPEKYCFCRQPSFGNMIACDNEKCPNGEWFHYKCVGLLNRAEAQKYTKEKWYCSEGCRATAAAKKLVKKKRKKSGW